MIDAELWRRLRECDPDTVTTRALVTLTDEGRYEVPVLGSRVWVEAEAQEVTSAWAEVIPVDYFLSISVVQYLISAREGELAGDWVSAQQLPYGEVFFRGPHALPGDALGALFGSDGERGSTGSPRPEPVAGRFRRVLGRLGGEPVTLGDVGAQVSVFPKLPIRLGLWLADEEFPARMTFLFDETAGRHLPVDALWSAVMVLAGAIRRLASSPQE